MGIRETIEGGQTWAELEERATISQLVDHKPLRIDLLVADGIDPAAAKLLERATIMISGKAHRAFEVTVMRDTHGF